MKPYAITVLIVASSAFSLALFEGLGWTVRKPSRQSFWFVLLCALSGVYAALCALQYNADTIAETVPFLRLETAVESVAGWALFQFFAVETQLVSARVRWGVTGLFGVFAAVQLVDLGSWTWDASRGGMTALRLPGGLAWSIPEAASGPITDVQVVAAGVFFAYLLLLAFQFVRKDPAKGRRLLPVPLVIAIAFANDVLIGYGVLSHPYALEFAFLAAVIYMRLDKAIGEKETAALLTRLAYYDPLTGLMNRAMFQDTLRAAIARSHRSGQPLALLFLDLDRFKAVNDTLGHAAGDKVLTEVAARLKARIRGSDTVARLGGDEFTIILEGLERRDDAAKVAQNLLQDLEAPIVVGPNDLYPGASIGIAAYPVDDATPEGLTRKADAAMYTAKIDGGDCFRFARSDSLARNRDRIDLESELHKALDGSRFVLHYQPQVDLRTRALVGAEALIRWDRRADGVLVAPGEFLGVAEETGLILPIGDWVLRTACTTAAWWRSQGRPLRISINVSPLQFRSPGFAREVERALAAAGLPAAALALELTESTLLRDDLRAEGPVRKLVGLGCPLCLDDFGTEASSLSALTKFPVQELKIDRSFVHGVASDPRKRSIVTALVVMAQGLGLRTVAEGVEQPAEHALLQSLGCPVGQGFLFGRAVDESGLWELRGPVS